jgi:membrane protease YdiL (CAAX protease family)
MKRSWPTYIVTFVGMIGLLVAAGHLRTSVTHEVQPGAGGAGSLPAWLGTVSLLFALLGVHCVAVFAATPSWRRRALYVARLPWSVLQAVLFFLVLVVGPPFVVDVVAGIVERSNAEEQEAADATAPEATVAAPADEQDAADGTSADVTAGDATSGDATSGDEVSADTSSAGEAAEEQATEQATEETTEEATQEAAPPESRFRVYGQLAIPLISVGILLAIAMGLRSRGRNAWRGLGFERRRVWRNIGIGVAAYLAFTWAILPVLGTLVTVLFDLLGLAVKEHVAIREYRESASPLVHAALILAIMFTAPVFEEIAFRGVMFQTIKRYAGSAAAIALSALVFAAAHPGLYVKVNILFLGLLFGYLFDKTGSIVPGITLHFLFNATSMVVLLLAG